MAKITTTTRNTSAPVTLTLRKADFKAKLSDRISLGQELYDRPIIDLNELEVNKRDFSIRNDYNSELLKQSFSSEANEYKVSYDDVNRYLHFFGGPTSTKEKLDLHKEEIHRKLGELSSLLNRVDLLKVSEQASEPIRINGQTNQSLSDNKQVFVVHGHNELVKI